VFRNLSTIGLPLSGRPSELIELALSFGFDGMDIDILDFCQQAEIYGVDHARRLMVSARLQASSIHLPITLAGDDATFASEVEQLPKLFEMAQATECSRATATIVPGSNEHSFKDLFELHRSRLDQIGNMASKHDVAIGLAIVSEAECRADFSNQFIYNYEGLLGLISSSHESIGAVIDNWSLHLTGESTSIISQLPAKRIVELRVSDAPSDVSANELIANQRLMPGETGVINCVELLQTAEKAGFEGPVTPWATRATLKGIGRERIVRLAGDRLETFWKDAGLPIEPRWFAPAATDEQSVSDAEVLGLPNEESDKSPESNKAETADA
jgi:sugar phosphate isomerase/epimerase